MCLLTFENVTIWDNETSPTKMQLLREFAPLGENWTVGADIFIENRMQGR